MSQLLTRIDLWIVVAYLAAMLFIALRVSSGSRNVEGYVVGNRSMSGIVLGFSVLGTFLSSITFLGLPATVFEDGNWSAYVFGLALPPAALIATLYFVPLYRKQTQLSAYELLAHRFGVWARIYADVSYLVLQLIRIGTVLLLVAFAAAPLLGAAGGENQEPLMIGILVALGLLVIVYDTLGGIRAVIWTDVLQVIILIGGALWCIAQIVWNWNDGLTGFLQATKWEMFSLGPWTSWDAKQGIWNWAAPSVLVVLIYGLTENLRNYGTDQNYVQRMLAARSDGEAAKSIWIGAAAVHPRLGDILFDWHRADAVHA